MHLAGLHSVCTQSNLHTPSSSLPVSAQHKTCSLCIFPLCCNCCSCYAAVFLRHTPTRSTSPTWHGCRHTTACSISYIFPPPPMAFIQQQTVPYDGQCKLKLFQFAISQFHIFQFTVMQLVLQFYLPHLYSCCKWLPPADRHIVTSNKNIHYTSKFHCNCNLFSFNWSIQYGVTAQQDIEHVTSYIT
jgi:hypothetical protein